MDHLLQDLRYALRRLAASPGFTLVAVLSLALGIGANTAVFSLVDRVLLYQPPVGEPETLMDVYQNYRGRPYWRLSQRHYESMKELEAFESVTAYIETEARLEPVEGRDVRAIVELVAGDYFGTLGVAPALGRDFSAEERAEDANIPVAVLSHEVWERELGSDPSVVGGTIRLNAMPYTVVGVAPEGFDGKTLPLIGADVFVPYGMNDHLRGNDPDATNMQASARLAAGVTPARARAELDALAARWEEREQLSDAFQGFAGYMQDDVLFAPGLDDALVPMTGLLLAVVGLVLLIACTNLASFLLARAADRKKEFAVRMAMGAGRRRIVGQLLLESLALGLLGGVAGIAVGRLTLDVVLGITPPSFPIPLDVEVPLSTPVLAATMGVAILASLLFGLAPAWQASRSEVAGTLRDESPGGGGRGKAGLRGALVAAQVAVSLVLLTGAGLFVRSLAAAAGVDPGFDAAPVAVVSVSPEMSGYDADEARRLRETLLRRTGEMPGVQASALGTRLPLELGNWQSGVRRPGEEDFHWLEVANVTPGYFALLDIELLQGRSFRPEDDAGPPVVILNQAAAERLFPGEDALGRTLDVSWSDEDGVVVGVTETTKVKTLGERPYPYMFRPMGSYGAGVFWLAARGRGASPEALARDLATMVKDVDADLFVQEPGTAADTVSLQLYLPRMGAWLLAVMGALALALATVGLYGVVSYAAARRVKEVGIRMSLGAGRGDVVRLVMGGGLRLVLLGAGLGLVLSLGAAQLLRRFLWGVGALDPVTFAVVPALLVAVAALASWLPARRAAKVDPIHALRSE